MKSLKKPLLFSLIYTTATLLPLNAFADIKCWTNKDGVRECGNAVPPEYAQQENRTINKRGITTEVRDRALTQKELEARQRRQETQQTGHEGEDRLKAEEEQRRKEQLRNDRVLLATFLTEEEIIRSRERQLVSIDANLELTRIGSQKLQLKLEEETSRAEKLESAGKPLPERMQEDIANLEQQLANKQRYITSKEKEREAIINKYDADIARFRELKGYSQQQP